MKRGKRKMSPRKRHSLCLMLAIILCAGAVHAEEYTLPSDDVLTRYMHQPVEKTLQGTGVAYVNMENLNAALEYGKSPAIMLLYKDSSSSAQYLATLANVLFLNYGEKLKLFAYKAGNLLTPKDALVERYHDLSLRESGLVLYKHANGEVFYESTYHAGKATLDDLKSQLLLLAGKIDDILEFESTLKKKHTLGKK
jgi:hypothetical protein